MNTIIVIILIVLAAVGLYFVIREKKPGMDLNTFAVKVTEAEGKKEQVNIAQVKEILKVTNDLLGGKLYKLIRG